MSESLKEGRRLVIIALTLSVLWLLTSGAVRTDLTTQRVVEDLAAWVLVNDAIKKAFREDEEGTFEDAKLGQTIAKYTKLVQVQSGTEVPEDVQLVLSPPWQLDGIGRFGVRRIRGPDQLLLFEVVSDVAIVDRANYLIGVFRNKPVVFSKPPAGASSVRDYFNIVFRDGYDGPNAKNAALNYLWSRGWKGRGVEDLKAVDPTVATAMREIRGQSYKISGLPISTTLYPAAVGILLGLLSFSLVGPIVRIRNEPIDLNREVWVMTVRLKGSLRWIIEAFQLLAIGVAIALPCLVAVQLIDLASLIDQWQRYLLFLGVAGAIAAAVSIAWFAYQVFRWTREAEDPTNQDHAQPSSA